ncbi:MAG: hypothetical protein HZA35_01435 [Parcubacteria group bacterium]|nr:hypothetical protein [Parcubacteria group bacterium]
MRKIIIFSLVVGALYYFMGHASVFSFVRRNSTFSSIGSLAANTLQGTRDFVYERVASIVAPSVEKAKDVASKETYRAIDTVAKKSVAALGTMLGITKSGEEGGAISTPQDPIIFLDKTLLSPSTKADIISGTATTLEAAVTLCSVYNRGEEIRSTLRIFKGGNDSYNSYMDWGDGNRSDLGALPEGHDASLSHAYTKAGEFTITLHVSDSKEEYTHKRSICIR